MFAETNAAVRIVELRESTRPPSYVPPGVINQVYQPGWLIPSIDLDRSRRTNKRLSILSLVKLARLFTVSFVFNGRDRDFDRSSAPASRGQLKLISISIETTAATKGEDESG